MGLFVVQHRHDSDTCPAADADIAPQLLQLLASGPQHGVTVLAEAVVNGQHELDLIASADGQATVEEFMAPFKSFGTVSIRPAATCEQVVQQGHC